MRMGGIDMASVGIHIWIIYLSCGLGIGDISQGWKMKQLVREIICYESVEEVVGEEIFEERVLEMYWVHSFRGDLRGQ